MQEAREKAEEARKILQQGNDPAVMKKTQKLLQVADSTNTLRKIAEEWYLKNKAKWKTAHEKWAKLENDIFPYLGDRAIKSITTAELFAVINRIEARGAIETAHRTKNIVREIYVYAIATGRAERNIAHDLTGALAAVPKSKHRATILIPSEIGGF